MKIAVIGAGAMGSIYASFPVKSSNIKEYYDHSFNIGIPQIDTQKLQNKLFGISVRCLLP